MNAEEIKHFEQKLLAEKKQLEEELAGIAKRNPQSAGGWEATTGGIEVDSADENEVADKLEELEENNGIAMQLERGLGEIKAALEKIKNKTYGICEVCGKPIEKERLEANPAARISIKHGHS